MFKIDRKKASAKINKLGKFTSGYGVGKLSLAGYRAIRAPVRSSFGTIFRTVENTANTIRWLNGAMSEKTGVPIIDDSMRQLQNEPVFRDVAVNVDSFYTQLEDIGQSEQQLNSLVENIYSSLGVSLSKEEEELIRRDFKDIIQTHTNAPVPAASLGATKSKESVAPYIPSSMPTPIITEPAVLPPRATIIDAVAGPGEKLKFSKTRYIGKKVNMGGTNKGPKNPLSPGEKKALTWIEAIGRTGSLFNPITRAGLVGGSLGS